MKKLIAFAGAVSCAGAGVPLAAQAEMVRASDPAGMVSVLEEAGYDAELIEDDIGDPLIKLVLGGYATGIAFYGCDAEKHTGCQSIQFSAGFDRENGWTAEEAIKLSSEYRFMAIELDDEMDPYVRWDVEIGEGIPRSVFLRSVLRFSETVDTATDIIFDD